MIHPVAYDLNGIMIAANAYYPANQINNVSGMVDYLIRMGKVDHERIGSEADTL